MESKLNSILEHSSSQNVGLSFSFFLKSFSILFLPSFLFSFSLFLSSTGHLHVCNGFWVCAFMGFLSVQMPFLGLFCVRLFVCLCFLCLFLGSSVFVRLFVCSVQFQCVTFALCYYILLLSLRSLFSNESEKGVGPDGWDEIGRSKGKGNHDQDVLNENKHFQQKKKFLKGNVKFQFCSVTYWSIFYFEGDQ